MSTELRMRPEPAELGEGLSAPGRPAVEGEALARAIEYVRRDSRSDARNYLEETVSKHGGE